MADPTTNAIDRVFDLVDKVADGADRVLNRSKHTEDQHKARRAQQKVVDTVPAVKVTQREAPVASATALATQRFRIVESTGKSGQTIFVVTNDAVRAECSTRELAEKILRGLEVAP